MDLFNRNLSCWYCKKFERNLCLEILIVRPNLNNYCPVCGKYANVCLSGRWLCSIYLQLSKRLTLCPFYISYFIYFSNLLSHMIWTMEFQFSILILPTLFKCTGQKSRLSRKEPCLAENSCNVSEIKEDKR